MKKRWVILELTIGDEFPDGDIPEYIEKELAWSRESFIGLDILEIREEYDIQLEREEDE